jgi:DNA repair protein RecO (recombination protein O)
MPYLKSDSVVIRHSEYSNTSRIFRFYTRRYGLLTALAKGVKRPKGRMIGQVDLFSHGEIVFVSGRFSQRMAILHEACADETFPRLRTELPRYYAASHAAALVQVTTAEQDPNPPLFDRLVELLRWLDGGADAAVALLAFEMRLLALSGFLPELARCVGCGKESVYRTTAVSPRLGGVICADCSAGEEDLIPDLPTGALTLLGTLASGRLTRLDRIAMSDPVKRHARRFLSEYERYLLGRNLPTLNRL